MNWLNQLTPLLFLVFAYLIYHMTMQNSRVDTFVPYNAFEAPDPDKMKGKDWQILNEKFGRLIQLVNASTFDVAYQLDDQANAFKDILNNMGVGTFNVISIGATEPFTLREVLVQDVNSLAVTKFSRVDFIVESMNPFKIQKMIITPDKQFVSSSNVRPTESLKPDHMFRMQNPLGLFYPYRSSDNEMIITPDDSKMFDKLIAEKATQLDLMRENTIKGGPTQRNPTNTGIVGAGPLYPMT